MSVKVGNSHLSICGSLEQRHAEKSIKISDFYITRCETDEIIRSYSALQPCEVISNRNSVTINELIWLPIGEGFQWIQTPYKTLEITDSSGVLTFGDEQFVLDLSHITDSDISTFVNTLPDYKGIGDYDDEETLVGKLLVCTLKGNKKCEAVFNDIKNHLGSPLDGASAEMYIKCRKVLEKSKGQ